MKSQRVCSVRRPRRLAIGLVVVTLVLVLLTYKLQTSPFARHGQTKLLVKTLRQDEQEDDEVIEDWRESLKSRSHRHRDRHVRLGSHGSRSRIESDDYHQSAIINGDMRIGSQSVTDSPELNDGVVVSSPATHQLDLDRNVDQVNDENLVNGHESDGRISDDESVKQVDNKQLSKSVIAAADTESVLSVKDINDGMNEDPTGDMPLPPLTSGQTSSGTFVGDLDRVVDFNKIVVLSVIDAGYVTMAINFFRTSVTNVGLKNFLMVCTDSLAVRQLHRQGIPCSPYKVPEFTNGQFLKRDVFKHGGNDLGKYGRHVGASDFGTAAYYQKSNAKTSVILTALEKGYSVLIIDVDVIMFKNPFPFFNCTACDAHFQMDREMYNSGFAFIRPTPASLRLYQIAWNLYGTFQKAHDQVYLNMAINRLNQNDVNMGYSRRVSNLNAVRLQSLPVSLFPCGAYYFERANRMFENQPHCEECVMAHNNYIGSVSAKIYRFKENLLWTIDDNQYYSNTSAQYFTYYNPLDFGLRTVEMELEALKSALAIAMATGRLLILPTFRCCSRNCRVIQTDPRIILVPDIPAGSNASQTAGTSAMECSDPLHRCSLLSVLKLSKFDKVFGNRYREHSFLSNRLVPENIKLGVSPVVIFINVSDISTHESVANDSSHVTVTPVNRDRGAKLSEIIQWMNERRDETVIRFHSLYGATVDWASDESFGLKLRQYFKTGFVCSEYEQWDADLLDLVKMWPENKFN